MIKIDNKGKTNSLIDQMLLITIITFSCKIIGFLREVLLAKYWGTSVAVDNFLVAEAIPALIFGWSTAIGTAFTPVYQELLVKQGEKKANDFFAVLLSSVTLVSLLCIILGCVFYSQILSFVVPNRKNQTDLIIMYFICLFSYIYYSKYTLVTNFLSCNKKYFLATWPNVLLSSVQIVFVFFGYVFHKAYFLALGVAIAYLCQYIVLLVSCIKSGATISFSLRCTKKIKEVFIISLPLIASTLVSRINHLIDKSFAASLSEGKIATLGYAYTLQQFFYGIMTMAVFQVFYPRISKLFAENKMLDIQKNIKQTIETLMVVLFPLSIVTCIFAKWIIQIVLQRGQFDISSTIMTAHAFQCYIIGLIAVVIRDITIHVCQSFKKMSIACILSVINICINVVLNIALINKYDYIGLAISTSISAFTIIPLEYWLLQTLIGFRYESKEILQLLKVLGMSLLIGIASYGAKSFLDSFFTNSVLIAKIFILLICFLIIGAMYFIFSYKLGLFSNDYFVIVKNRFFKMVKR